MANLRIKPIHVGTLYADKSAQTYMRNYGVPYELPCVVWYIEGAEKKVLVDSGPCSPEWSKKYHWPMTQTPEQQPDRALRLAGIEPESIEVLILTHLHWDHAYNNHLFPNAEFFIQQAELRYAISPLPIHSSGYEAVSMGMQPDYYTHTKYTVLKGDQEILPGVSALLTPGHTPGSMSVVVDTAKGKYIIASDTVPTYESWEGNPVIKHIPNTIHIGLVEYYESFEKLEKVGGIVLPGHDGKVLEHEYYPY